MLSGIVNDSLAQVDTTAAVGPVVTVRHSKTNRGMAPRAPSRRDGPPQVRSRVTAAAAGPIAERQRRSSRARAEEVGGVSTKWSC